MTLDAAEIRRIINFSSSKVTPVCPKQGAIPYRAWPAIPDEHASKQTKQIPLCFISIDPEDFVHQYGKCGACSSLPQLFLNNFMINIIKSLQSYSFILSSTL